MSSIVRFVIAVLVILLIVFAVNTYKTGGFDNLKPASAPVEHDVESH